MNKWLIPIMIMIILVLTGCSVPGRLTGRDRPPDAMIEINGRRYETVLGTYCWQYGNKGTCVDTAGPVELLKGKEPIPVEAGAGIRFVMEDDWPLKEFHVSQHDGDQITDVKLNEDGSFHAPQQPGIYYYSYGVWWKDEKKPNVSHGDAFYNFVIEVK